MSGVQNKSGTYTEGVKRNNSELFFPPTTRDALRADGCQKELELAYRTLRACRSDPSACRRDDLDQCPATIKTTLRRLALLLGTSRLERHRVLLLGDDDLLSVAIAATGLSTAVTVIDLDDSLLARIARWTKSEIVELVHHDLRLGLPSAMAAGYDVVFTDPPYTPAGQLLFLRAGTMALRNTSSSSLFLCSSSLYLSPKQMQRIIATAEQAGYQLIQLEEDFNKYKAPPDVVKDIRRRKLQRDASYFYSSLLHFVPSGYRVRPESLPFLPSEIYRYEE